MRNRTEARSRGLAVAVASLLTVSGAAGSSAKPPELPSYAPAARVIWLNQGWTDQQRRWFHHASQGTATLPLPTRWFLALERPIPSLSSPGLLSDPAYLDRFGFIASPREAQANPDGLPIGLVRTRVQDPTTDQTIDQLGFTCAACHTGRLDYRGTQILIDGGSAMTDLGKFRKSLAYALGLTLLSPPRFKRFADRVLGSSHNPLAGVQLHNQLAKLVKAGIDAQRDNPASKGSVEEGFSRLDALNRIGNEVFANQMKQPANYAPLSAPVAYPHIWDTHWFDWVQYNSSIEQPMVRNAGEAMGVRALVNYSGGTSPRFTSTVPVDMLDAIETALAGSKQPTAENRFTGLRSPTWPATILPAIDSSLAAQGRELYARNCAGCHLPAPNSDAFWASSHWLPANAFGQRYLRPVTVSVKAIGTDPAQAEDMKARTVRVPLAFGFDKLGRTVGREGVYPYGSALGQVVERVVERWYDSRNPATPTAERSRMNGFRNNGIRDGLPGANETTIVYKARPLNGIWATAPYLHNGSIPTLYDLLSPYEERPKKFWLGNREFDPVKVGYVTTRLAGGFELVAVDPRTGVPVRGNGNGGHLFESPASPAQRRPGTIGPALSPQERAALVEYLKTL